MNKARRARKEEYKLKNEKKLQKEQNEEATQFYHFFNIYFNFLIPVHT